VRALDPEAEITKMLEQRREAERAQAASEEQRSARAAATRGGIDVLA
jgi:hypothetical protein